MRQATGKWELIDTENMTQKHDSLLYAILRQNEYGYIIENSNLQVEERNKKEQLHILTG